MPENFLSAEDRPTVAFIAICTLVAAFLIVSVMYWIAGDNTDDSLQLGGNPAQTEDTADDTSTTTGSAAREVPQPVQAH